MSGVKCGGHRGSLKPDDERLPIHMVAIQGGFILQTGVSTSSWFFMVPKALPECHRGSINMTQHHPS